MKKSCFFGISAAFIFLSSQPTFSKTSGDYLSFELLRSEVSFQEKSASPSKFEYLNGTASDDGLGFGISYKHSYTIEEIFIAPGVFFEFNNAEAKMTKKDSGITNENRKLVINNRYGLRVDAGLDVTDVVAPYITLGVANVEYSTTDWSKTPADAKTKNGNKVGGFFGAGLKVEPHKNVAIYFEWQSQKGFNAKTAAASGGGGFEAKIDVMKLGVAYKF
jgi:opacity protein-like surface antigen